MTTSPLFVWAGKLNDQVKVQDHATSLILEASSHETSRLWWERLSDVGWLCTGLGRSWRHHLPPEGALAIPSSPDQKTSRPLDFLKNGNPIYSASILRLRSSVNFGLQIGRGSKFSWPSLSKVGYHVHTTPRLRALYITSSPSRGKSLQSQELESWELLELDIEPLFSWAGEPPIINNSTHTCGLGPAQLCGSQWTFAPAAAATFVYQQHNPTWKTRTNYPQWHLLSPFRSKPGETCTFEKTLVLVQLQQLWSSHSVRLWGQPLWRAHLDSNLSRSALQCAAGHFKPRLGTFEVLLLGTGPTPIKCIKVHFWPKAGSWPLHRCLLRPEGRNSTIFNWALLVFSSWVFMFWICVT